MVKTSNFVAGIIAHTFNGGSLAHKPAYAKQIDSYNHGNPTVAELKSTLDSLSGNKFNISSLEKKIAATEKTLINLSTDSLGNLNMVFQPGTPIDQQLAAARAFLTNQLDECKASLVTKREAKEARDKTRQAYEAALKSFRSQYKKGYAEWKKAVGSKYAEFRKTKNADGSDLSEETKKANSVVLAAFPPNGSKFNYKYAKSELVTAGEHAVVYGILLEEDEIKSFNFKTSKLSKVIEPFSLEFGEVVTKAVLKNHWRRVKEAAANEQVPPSTIGVEDFVNVVLEDQSPISIYYQNSVFTNTVKSVESVKQVLTEVALLKENDRKRVIYDQIKKAVAAKFTEAGDRLTDEVYFPVISYLIEGFASVLCEACKANTITMNNQVTIKPKVLHTVLRPLYINKNQSYAEKGAWIESQMATVKKEPSSASKSKVAKK